MGIFSPALSRRLLCGQIWREYSQKCWLEEAPDFRMMLSVVYRIDEVGASH